MKAKSRGAQRASKRKKSQQPARGKGTPGMTRMCSGTTTVCYQLIKELSPPHWLWAALPPVLLLLLLLGRLHSAQLQPTSE